MSGRPLKQWFAYCSKNRQRMQIDCASSNTYLYCCWCEVILEYTGTTNLKSFSSLVNKMKKPTSRKFPQWTNIPIEINEPRRTFEPLSSLQHSWTKNKHLYYVKKKNAINCYISFHRYHYPSIKCQMSCWP